MLALAVIGGGVYGGYRWTQNQFYVGVEDDNVALYRGISQDLAWLDLSKVEESTGIELKYLPPYQRKQVEATIAEGNLADAREKVDELKVQASACEKDAKRRAAEAEAAKSQDEDADSTSAKSPTEGSKKTATPTPGPSLSEEEKKLVPQCGKQ